MRINWGSRTDEQHKHQLAELTPPSNSGNWYPLPWSNEQADGVQWVELPPGRSDGEQHDSAWFAYSSHLPGNERELGMVIANAEQLVFKVVSCTE
jgi:hypothetical protein